MPKFKKIKFEDFARCSFDTQKQLWENTQNQMEILYEQIKILKQLKALVLLELNDLKADIQEEKLSQQETKNDNKTKKKEQ